MSAALSCTGDPEAPVARGAPDPRQEYIALQELARTEMQVWQSSPAPQGDPRPAWAGRLETFARAHPGTPEAAEALLGSLELRAARFDVKGFFATYGEALRAAPDAPALPSVFAHVTAMRLVETGGPGIMQSTDLEIKKRAYRSAAPLIASDLQACVAATRNTATKAAAHYAIAMTWYQLEVDAAKALEHFIAVAEGFPESPQADAAREHARELSTLGVGMPAPAFEAVTLEGKRLSLGSLKGRVVLVDFWATWCQPCLDELPQLKRAHQRFRSRGLTILGISLDADREAVRTFITANRMGWPIVASGLAMEDPLARAYAVQMLPMSYLIGRDGVIRGRSLFGSDVERAVEALLGAP